MLSEVDLPPSSSSRPARSTAPVSSASFAEEKWPAFPNLYFVWLMAGLRSTTVAPDLLNQLIVCRFRLDRLRPTVLTTTVVSLATKEGFARQHWP